MIRGVRYDVRLVGPESVGPLSETGVGILEDVSRFCEKRDHWKISGRWVFFIPD